MADDPFVLHAELVARLLDENDGTKRIIESYVKLYRELTNDWLEILREAPADGTEEAFHYLQFRASRIEQLRLQTAHQIERFSRQAEQLVKVAQSAAVVAAQAHAAEVTTALFRILEPSLHVSFALLPARALEDLVGKFSNGAPLARLFDDFGPRAAQGTYDALFRAVATGTHPIVAAGAIRRELGIPLTRALTIARTEMLGSYRTSTLRAYEQNSDLVAAWRWNAHLDARTCMSCVALHGSIHPITETMHEHVNGRCVPSPALVPLAELGDVQGRIRSRLGIDRTGQQYWDELSDEEKLRRLGPGKFALMQDGKIDLEDMVYADSNQLWGTQYREASIAQALEQHSSGRERFTYTVGGR